MASMMDRSRPILMLPLRLLRTPVTIVQGIRKAAREPTSVGEARRAFVEDMTGRVKAVTGFVLGDDRMLTTGQIERAKAAQRLAAMADEAAAEATERKASDRFARQVEQSRLAKERATKEETRKTAAIDSQTKTEKARADSDAARGRQAAHRAAVADEQVLDVTDIALGAEAATVLDTAAGQEMLAEEARSEAEAIKRARRESTPGREA